PTSGIWKRSCASSRTTGSSTPRLPASTAKPRSPICGRTSRSPEAQVWRLLQWLAAATLFALMAVVSVDVVGRYLFNRPLPAGYELVQVLMGLMVFTALPLISRQNDQITIGLLDHLFKGSDERWRLAFVNGFSALVLGV